uniref:Uncharacterized protein n=1 Tax=Arundo donax TaxID=35708 RepID=A0A0A9BAK6_ARUDO
MRTPSVMTAPSATVNKDGSVMSTVSMTTDDPIRAPCILNQ